MGRWLDDEWLGDTSRGWARMLGAAALVVAGAGGLAACGGGGGGNGTPDAAMQADAAPPPPWWQPKVAESKNWDIQLAQPIDISTPRLMYDLDLWSLVPAPTTLDYGGGRTVTVPAGAMATAIATLHATTPPTIVVCHVDVGELDLGLPDAAMFPGYHADPAMIPDSPKPVEAGSAIGWRVGTSTKRWLDLRTASRGAWTPVMLKRFDLAKQIGCDAVDADGIRAAEFPTITGFSDIMATDSISWFLAIADEGHNRKLSMGMKNGQNLGDQVDKSAEKFDWMMIERCGESIEGDGGDCDTTRPFVNLQKAVFAVDYDHDATGAAQASTAVCPNQGKSMIADGIYKDFPPTKNVRTQCEP